ncbi:MAG: DUF3598 family protein [Symploca sp. SIO2B6]|nr:DUF3598 family protein [Symploca sp. SIO2B6]
MRTQWESHLQNLGEWHGSFTRLSPQGQQLEDIPSILILEQLNDKQQARLTLRRFRENLPVNELVYEYSSIERNLLFFENGAFSRGALRWGAYSEFWAEFGLIEANRRLRMVQQYNRDSQLRALTLIRERLVGTDTPEGPQLTFEQLLGEWEGKAITIYPELQGASNSEAESPHSYPTKLKIEYQGNNHLVQQLTFETGTSARTITSTARIDGSILHFEHSPLPTQVLLLPDGASCNCPLEIKPGSVFVLELGWLLQPNKRQRLIRTYSDQGEWLSLTFVEEYKL